MRVNWTPKKELRSDAQTGDRRYGISDIMVVLKATLMTLESIEGWWNSDKWEHLRGGGKGKRRAKGRRKKEREEKRAVRETRRGCHGFCRRKESENKGGIRYVQQGQEIKTCPSAPKESHQ